MASYLIIGASSGIGGALANRLSSQNTVYGTFNTGRIANPQVKAQQFDVLSDDFSGLQIPEILDGLVYCPGAINLKPFGRFSDEDFIKDYQLQVLGAVKAVRQALPALRKSAQASVVFFSSVAAQKGYPFHALISTHKAALEGLTKAPLAGAMLNSDEKIEKMSALNPMKRVGQPEDLAAAAVYLLSPESAWVTGQVLHVDGGASVL